MPPPPRSKKPGATTAFDVFRDQEFGPGLFGEPAQDLLLDLYIAASDPRLVSVMSAAIAASVSTRDTARWVILLEEHGLVERFHSGDDASRAIGTLSQSAFNQMTRLLLDHR